jgi:HPr kinase/phosphorylase
VTGGKTLTGEQSNPPPMVEVTVRALASDPRLGVRLSPLAGEAGLDRPIRHPRVQKSGLALAGHFLGVVPTRVQVLGETELSYVETLSPDRRGLAARGFFSLGLSCVVITQRSDIPRPLVQAAEATGTPLFLSEARSSRTINALHALLDEKLAPSTSLHGVLVDVFGIGLLLLGKSGIGKSECAVELVLRSHRLVADDVVRCEWRPPGMVFGSPADMLENHVEVRGLGLLNIKDLFGVTAVRERKRIDMVVKLEEWSEHSEYDRLGVDDQYFTVLSTKIRQVTVPVRPGRDMGAMLEMAARNELLRRAGRHSAKELLARLEENAGLAPEVAIDDLPESVLGASSAPNTSSEAAPPPDSSAAHPEALDHDSEGQQRAARPQWGAGTESSAWIPAVRPPPKGGA